MWLFYPIHSGNTFLFICTIYIFFGVVGYLINRPILIFTLVCIELLFYGLNMSLISYGYLIDDYLGQSMAFFILPYLTSEAAIAFALLMVLVRVFNEPAVDEEQLEQEINNKI